MDVKPEGYAVDKKFPGHHLRAGGRALRFAQAEQCPGRRAASRTHQTAAGQNLRPPVRLQGAHGKAARRGPAWRLVGTVAEGTLCHKPCTVSGGGKSEISKPITDAILTGPVFVADFKKDFDQVAELIDRDYSGRFLRQDARRTSAPFSARSVRSARSSNCSRRTSSDYTPEYNAWLDTVPQYIKELVFVVKRYYKPEWGDELARPFQRGHHQRHARQRTEMRQPQAGHDYLRVGFDADGSWRTFGLRKDFHPAVKVQMEDDITASVVVPAGRLEDLPEARNRKRVAEIRRRTASTACSSGPTTRFTAATTSRPKRISRSRTISFPITSRSRRQARARTDRGRHRLRSIHRSRCRRSIRESRRERRAGLFCLLRQSAARGRQADEKPALPPDAARPASIRANRYLAEMSARLRRRLPPGKPVHNPVNAVLPGRRNNPPEPGIRSLACYNPIHYFELPELFMEFICSMTGKSPSTTGAGSEGALTKGPFNALPPIIDLNNALVSLHAHRPPRLRDRRRLRRPEGARGPRHQPARAGSLVPHVAGGTRPAISDRQRFPGKMRGLRARRQKSAGQPARLPHQRAVRPRVFRPRVQPSARRVHRRDAAAGTAGHGHFRRRHGQHRRHAKARGARCISTTAASRRPARR